MCEMSEMPFLKKVCTVQANYINALAVSISPIFDPAKGTLGGFPPPRGWIFLMTLGELFKSGRC
jgi:hypothetical protein